MNKWIANAPELTAAVAAYEKNRFAEAISICTDHIGMGGQDTGAALLLRSLCFAAMDRPDDAQYDHGRGVIMIGATTPSERFELADEAMDRHLPNSYCAVMLERAGEQLEKQSDGILMAASAWNKAGICYYRAGQLEQEIECFERAQQLLIDLQNQPAHEQLQVRDGDHTMTLVSLLALVRSNLAESFQRFGRFDDAITLYDLSAQGFGSVLDAGSLFDLEHYALSLRSLSELYRAAEGNVRASSCLTRAIEALSARKDDCPPYMLLQLSGCYNARGTLRFQVGDYSGEVSDCTESLRLREGLLADMTDAGATATIYFNRAEAYGELGEIDREIADFCAGIGVLEGADNNELKMILCVRRFGLGKIYEETRRFDDARLQYKQAADGLKLLHEMNPLPPDTSDEQLSEMEALCRYNLATCRGEDDASYYESITEYLRAAELLKHLPLTPDRAGRLTTVYNAIGEVYELFDEYDKARENFLEAEHYRTIAVLDELAAERMGETDGGEMDRCSDSISDGAAECNEDIEYEDDIWSDPSDDTPEA